MDTDKKNSELSQKIEINKENIGEIISAVINSLTQTDELKIKYVENDKMTLIDINGDIQSAPDIGTTLEITIKRK